MLTSSTRTSRVARLPGSAAIVMLALTFACQGQADTRALGTRTLDDPHDTDSLYALLRRTLVDKDPHPAMQAYYCGVSLLTDRLGEREAERRLKALLDTVYATPDDRRRRIQAASNLGNSAFFLDEEHCGPDFDSGFHFHPTVADTGREPELEPTPELRIHVSAESSEPMGKVRVVAEGGRVVSHGVAVTTKGGDTVRMAAPFDYSSRSVYASAIFFADPARRRLHVVVRVGGKVMAESTGVNLAVTRSEKGVRIDELLPPRGDTTLTLGWVRAGTRRRATQIVQTGRSLGSDLGAGRRVRNGYAAPSFGPVFAERVLNAGH